MRRTTGACGAVVLGGSLFAARVFMSSVRASNAALSSPPSSARRLGDAQGRARTRKRWLATLWTLVLVVTPARVEAFDVSGGVSVGGIMAGSVPYLAVSPHGTVALPLGGDFFIAAHGMASILPGSGRSLGVYVPISAALTYKWETRTFSLGPSLALFYLPACGVKYCARTTGVAPGAHAQVEAYFLGPFGVSVTGNVDWIIGDNSVLAGDVAGMIVAGPVVRWEREVTR